VIVLFAQVALTPLGKPVGVPMPVAPVVVMVMLGESVVLTQSVGFEGVAAAVLVGFTVT